MVESEEASLFFMSNKTRKIFLTFGIAVLAVMVSQLNFDEVWQGLSRAGYWFAAVIFLWAFLYLFNAKAWEIIIKSDNSEEAKRLTFSHIYKLTVSGFALNYATPGGLMGGEPYRIMSISPYVGTEKASSSVILYAMTHMFSHFWFWALSIVLFLVSQHITMQLGILLFVCTLFCLLGLWFFMTGYRKGLANRALNIARHIPFLKRWAEPFVEAHREQLNTIDSQIAALHSQNPVTFVTAVLLELSCRIVSSLEIYFILLVLMPEVSFVQCILILAFTSLFANLMFFIPLQLVGREGGFLMSTAAFGITTNAGIFLALLVRIREIIWTALGLALISITKSKE